MAQLYGSGVLDTYRIAAACCVAPSVTTVGTTSFNGVTGTANSFGSQVLATISPASPAATFSVPSGTPAWIVSNATTGAISITSGAVAGTYTVVQTISNGCLPNATRTVTITITAALVAPTFTSSPLAITTNQGTAASSSAPTTTGTAPITYSLSGQPSGVTVNSTTGVVTVGATAVVGSGTFQLIASNGTLPNASQTVTYTVNAVTVAPTFTSAAPSITTNQGTAASSSAPTTTGTAPITYSLSGQPSGVTVNSTTGVVTVGATTAVGTGTFQLIASNGTLPNATQTVTYTVNAASAVGQIVGPLASITSGTPSSQILSTTGSVTSIQPGPGFPAWAGLTSVAGNFILQTAAPPGTTSPQNITFLVTNANGTVSQTLPIVVNSASVALDIQPPFTFAGVHGSPVTGTATATGGTPPYTFSLVSADANTTGYVTVNANGTWTLSGSVP